MCRMNDVTKLKLARIASSAAFWIAVGVVFLQHSGLSLTETYQLLSIYYLAVVFLEFPTGVIGDHFSHKLAVVLGQFIGGAALIAIAFTSGFWLYAILLIAAALGITLVSGSDTALLHAISKNFKKDQTQIKMYSMTTVVAATTLGSLLATVDIRLPIMLTGIFSIIAAFITLTVRTNLPKEERGNIFRTALGSLRHIGQRPIIMHLLGIGAVSAGFFISLKWFYNPLLEQMGIPLAYWGLIMGISLLTPILGVKLYQLSKRTHIVSGFVLLALSMIPIGFVQIAALSIIAMYAFNFLAGYVEAAVDIKLNATIQTQKRAAILSLSNLITRLVASVYMPVAGFVIETTSFFVLMSLSAAALLIIGGYSLNALWRHQFRPDTAHNPTTD